VIIQKQKECGWVNFFEGLILREWQLAMQLHLRWMRSQKSSKRWVAALIRKMWQVAWDLWEHRNGYLHDREDNLLSIQVNNSIIIQFDLGYKKLDRATQALFSGGLHSILAKPFEIRQQWVRRVQSARDMESTQTTRAYIGKRRIMAKWLRASGGKET
jgi:hypothetical protein